jgi:hypothetical protein
MAIIACLVRERFTLSMTINMDATSRVYFFIRDPEADAAGRRSAAIRMPNLAAGAGLGEKDTLSVYRPLLVRSKSSFFRSYHGRGGPSSMRRKVISSLRKKVMVRGGQPRQQQQQQEVTSSTTTAMTYKPQKAEPAWWQQTSTDVSSDYEDN